jgi:hypothetical protein
MSLTRVLVLATFCFGLAAISGTSTASAQLRNLKCYDEGWAHPMNCHDSRIGRPKRWCDWNRYICLDFGSYGDPIRGDPYNLVCEGRQTAQPLGCTPNGRVCLYYSPKCTEWREFH